MPLIRVAAVIFMDDENRVLSVRKRRTQRFMLPGGKPEAGEEFIDTACREVHEELGLTLTASDVEPFAVFHSAAANEPGHGLESHVFRAHALPQTPQVAAEIEELRWLSDADILARRVPMAPMLEFDAAPRIFDRPPSDAAAYAFAHERVHGRPPVAGEASLSVAAYDKERAKYLAEKGIDSSSGRRVWPPTSQSLMKHLGGSWSAAMTSLGLVAGAGREAGGIRFDDDAYVDAMKAFAAQGGTTFTQYVEWVKQTRTAALPLPSGAAIRAHFGSWDAAKKAAQG